MWLNKGMSNPIWFRIQVSGIPFGLGFVIPFGSGFIIPFGSGFRHPASGVMFFLSNFFYTFVKNIFLNLPPWNMEQIGQQYSKSLKLQHKIDLKCSRGTGT
jgi:hypothetical protein